MQAANYSKAVKAEMNFTQSIQIGSQGPAVQRVQEWLCHHNFGTKIDGDFGLATADCVKRFQLANNLLTRSGIVDQTTWLSLISPLATALANGQGTTLPQRIWSLANQHLSCHPKEYGGDNRGPWVRIYTGGYDGPEWRWCAGFVSFILNQACIELALPMPIAGSLSCDTLASQATMSGHFISGGKLQSGGIPWSSLGPVYIFVVRRLSGDYCHTGIGFGGTADVFSTIEGNTNDDGSENGYEVAARTRSADKKDFIRII